jgi:hypothetical protein
LWKYCIVLILFVFESKYNRRVREKSKCKYVHINNAYQARVDLAAGRPSYLYIRAEASWRGGGIIWVMPINFWQKILYYVCLVIQFNKWMRVSKKKDRVILTLVVAVVVVVALLVCVVLIELIQVLSHHISLS